MLNVFAVSLFRYLFLLLVGYVVLYPLFFMISNAIKSDADFLNIARIWLPKFWTFDRFINVWEITNFGAALKQSILVQLISAAIEVLMCSFAGYGLARYDFKFKKVETILLILLLLVPVQMYSLSLSVTYKNLGIFDTPFVYYLLVLSSVLR